jgi:hypothetical protein
MNIISAGEKKRNYLTIIVQLVSMISLLTQILPGIPSGPKPTTSPLKIF